MWKHKNLLRVFAFALYRWHRCNAPQALTTGNTTPKCFSHCAERTPLFLFLHNAEIIPCIMQELLIYFMQKTLPSQKILRSGFRTGVILPEGSCLYCAYEKHWSFRRFTGMFLFWVFFWGGRECFWRITPRQEQFIAELTVDVPQKSTPDVPK